MSFWTVGGPSAAEQVRGARGFSLTFSAGTGGPSAADRPTEKLPGCFSPQSYACLRAWGKCQSKYKPQEGETWLWNIFVLLERFYSILFERYRFYSIRAGLYKTSFLFYSSRTGFILLEDYRIIIAGFHCVNFTVAILYSVHFNFHLKLIF